MGIIELIKQIGEENIIVQPLSDCITGATYRTKLKATEVRFLTNQFSCNDVLGAGSPDGKIGLILWIEKSKIPK